MMNFVQFICAPDWGSFTDNFPPEILVAISMNLQFDQTVKHTRKSNKKLQLKINLWKNFEVEMIDFVWKTYFKSNKLQQ